MDKIISYSRYSLDEIHSLKDQWLDLNYYHIPVVTTFTDRFSNVNFEEHYQGLSKHEETFGYVATLDGTTIGFIIAIRNGKTAEIDSIYVISEYRNKGIGDNLMKKALNELVGKCSEIIIKVAEGNEQPFHFKNQFRKRYTVFQYDYDA